MGKVGEAGRASEGFYGFDVNDTSLVEHGIRPGDMIIVEFTADVKDGELYIVRLGNEVVSRHLYRLNGKLKVVAANGDSETLEMNRVEVLGRIIQERAER